MKTYYDIYVISPSGAIIKRFNAGTDAHVACDATFHIAAACPAIYPLADRLRLIGRRDSKVVFSYDWEI